MSGMNGWLDNPWFWSGFIGFLLMFGLFFGGQRGYDGATAVEKATFEAPKFSFWKMFTIIFLVIVASLWILGWHAWNGNFLAMIILAFVLVGGFVMTVVLVIAGVFIGFEAIDEYFDNSQLKIVQLNDQELDRETKRLRNKKLKRDLKTLDANVVEMGGEDNDGMVIDQGFN